MHPFSLSACTRIQAIRYASVVCLNPIEQIAQKLHGCTGQYSKGRDRDVLDILVIELLDKMDATSVRRAAELVFTQRATHKFPPAIEIPADWNSETETLAKELGYPATTAADIDARFRACVDRIANS